MTVTKQQKWIYAAALACLWASSEIIIGSFLHNLKVPMRGTMLASVAVIIMSAIGYRHRLKGIYWRAGILTAAMKTLSPSAVLLGPMMAITVQGFLMEIIISSGGPRRFFFILGGALSITWNFVHLILGYWLYYGNDVVVLGAKLVEYARKETGWDFISGWGLVAAFGSVYFTAGLVAGVIGTSIPKADASKTLHIPRKEKQSQPQMRKGGNDNQERSLFWLFLLPVIVASMLSVMSWLPLAVTLFAWSAIISMLVIRYRNSFRRLAKPGFWVIFLLLTVLSSLMLGPTIEEGLMIGLRMNLRAILFVLVLSALSYELRNEKLAKAFNKRNKGFLSTLETCFDTLPMVISILPPVRSILRNPRESLALFAGTFNVWVDSMHFKQLDESPILLITGAKGSGKSRMLNDVIIPDLQRRDIGYAGIVMQYLFRNDEHVGYTIRMLPDGEEKVLVAPDVSDAQLVIGKYAFSSSAFAAGADFIRRKKEQVAVAIIDECGWLETYGLGWYDIVKEIRMQGMPMIVVVRPDLADDFVKFWNLKVIAIVDTTSSEAEQKESVAKLAEML